jgi:hypothetical protein
MLFRLYILFLAVGRIKVIVSPIGVITRKTGIMLRTIVSPYRYSADIYDVVLAILMMLIRICGVFRVVESNDGSKVSASRFD